MIREQFVSFENAKLLQEIGCPDFGFSCIYDINGVKAQTQSIILQWLRVVHNIDINITCEYQDILNASGEKIKVYEVDIIATNGNIYIGNWNHYESAVDAAINYCITHNFLLKSGQDVKE